MQELSKSNLSIINLLLPGGTIIYMELQIVHTDVCMVQSFFQAISITLHLISFPLANSPYKSCFKNPAVIHANMTTPKQIYISELLLQYCCTDITWALLYRWNTISSQLPVSSTSIPDEQTPAASSDCDRQPIFHIHTITMLKQKHGMPRS